LEVHQALGDPSRLAILDALALEDLSAGELARRLALSHNLLSHHIKLMMEAGLIGRRVSDVDRRKSFLHITSTGFGYADPTIPHQAQVLFVCSRNSARSVIAESLWHQSMQKPARSAGIQPARAFHPLAVAVLESHGMTPPDREPALFSSSGLRNTLVISVCDAADSELSTQHVPHLHWSVEDPALSRKRSAFEVAFETIQERVERLKVA